MASVSALLVFSFLLCASSSALANHIVILAGQSNMVGRGGTDKNGWNGITPPECESKPQILRLGDNLMWEEAREPLHKGISVNCSSGSGEQPFGIGPGMPFSNSVLRRDPTIGVIRLVPCAVGGTNISQWARGDCLYARLLKRVRAAMRDGGELRAMLWYQGESDCENLEEAAVYGGRLEQFFNDVRSDLMAPSLPIIQVALASGGDISVREIVRKAQLNTSLANVKCVDAAGLPLGDGLHLTTESQIELASKLADAFLA